MTERLHPTFEIEGVMLVMSVAELAGVSRDVLGECVANVAERRDEIVAALDFLFYGF